MSEITKDRKAPSRWTPDGHDFILHLGTMRRAVIIRRFVPSLGNVWNGRGSWYAISEGSYFPFTDEQKEVRFDNPYDAIDHAEKIVLEWLNSISIRFSENKSSDKKLLTTNSNLID